MNTQNLLLILLVVAVVFGLGVVGSGGLLADFAFVAGAPFGHALACAGLGLADLPCDGV